MFGKELGLLPFEERLGGGSKFRKGKSFPAYGGNVVPGLVGERSGSAIADKSEAVERRDGLPRHVSSLKCLVHEPEAVAVMQAFHEKTGQSGRTFVRRRLEGRVVGKRER